MMLRCPLEWSFSLFACIYRRSHSLDDDDDGASSVRDVLLL